LPGWRAVWFLPGLKADCWLLLGPEGCKVEPSLGGGGLEVGGAGLRSGGWGTSSLGEEPWALVAWALAEAMWCHLRRKKTSKYSVQLTHPHTHCLAVRSRGVKIGRDRNEKNA